MKKKSGYEEEQSEEGEGKWEWRQGGNGEEQEEEEEKKANGLLALSTRASAHNLFRNNPNCGH